MAAVPCSASTTRITLRAIAGTSDKFQLVLRHPRVPDLCVASFSQDGAIVYSDSCKWVDR